ncbi:MAG: STAS domain-containing protein [Alphaproteobacteria bacterium]|nr:STAS domain-containing protein [Alphaproteobacteria bacterium]
MASAIDPSAPWLVTEPEIMEMDQYLSSANAPDLEEDARLCIASGARDMVFDCARLGYLTGAGARAFLAVARMMGEAGGKLAIRNLNGQPRDLFLACGLDACVALDGAAASSSSGIRAA